MGKLVVLLAITTVLFAGTTAYLYLERESPGPRSADTVPAEVPATEPRPSPAPVVTLATQTPAPPEPPAARTSPIANKAAAPRSQANEFEQTFLARATDPARRPQLLEETKVGLRQRYPGLERVPGLDAATYDPLMSLLAEQLVEMHQASIECKYASTCGTQLPQLKETHDAQLAALLGPEGKQQYEAYLESRSERLSVNSMRGRLTDKNRLPDSQAEALTLALADERQRIANEMSQRGETAGMIFDGVPFVYSPNATYDDLMKQATAYQARLRTRAATLLTPRSSPSTTS